MLIQVFTRLHKLGLCLSYDATIKAVKTMGMNHDKLVLDWKKNVGYHSHEQSDNEGSDLCADKGDDATNESCQVDDAVVPKAGVQCDVPTDQSVIMIGDNWDKNINPRDMRMNNQVKSLHHFYVVAVTSRIPTLHMDDKEPKGGVRDIPISEFLPSIKDCRALCNNYVVLVARVITENFKHFSYLHDCVPKHIYQSTQQVWHKKPQQ